MKALRWALDAVLLVGAFLTLPVWGPLVLVWAACLALGRARR